jgi:hypothetical protein
MGGEANVSSEPLLERIVAAFNRRADSPIVKLGLLALVALAVYVRDRRVFDSPRFWAEEGSAYFQYSETHPGLSGLANVAAVDYAPYAHPIPQLATWIAANWVSLEHAPIVTTAAWVLVVLVVMCIALWGKAELLSTPLRRVAAIAALLLAVSNSEVWVNSLGAHVWADIGLLLLVLEGEHVAGRRRRLSLAVFTLLAILSPTSWMLLPATLALCAHRWKAHRPYLVALGLVVATHVAVKAMVFASGARTPATISEAAHLIVSKLLLWPLAGPGIADGYAQQALRWDSATFKGVGLALALGLVALVVVFARFSRRDATTSALLWTHLTATAAFVFLGLGVGRNLLPLFHGARYTWLPNALLILLLAHQLDLRSVLSRKPPQVALGLALAAALVVGVTQYRYPLPIRAWSSAPDWRAEVARYRHDPAGRELAIAPSGWKVVVVK